MRTKFDKKKSFNKNYFKYLQFFLKKQSVKLRGMFCHCAIKLSKNAKNCLIYYIIP